MLNNSDNPTPASRRGRRPGSKDTKPRKPRVIGSNDGQKGSTSKPRAAVVPAWVENKGLKPKHALFIAEYLVDKNAKAAAIRAGYSPVTAGRVGFDLLHRDPKTSVAIKEALEAQQVRTGITADKVLLELANIAFSRPTAIMTWGPDGLILKDSESLAPEDVALVSEVSETKGTDKGGGSLKVKLHDKMKALELLGRNMGIFQDVSKVQVQDVGSAPQEVQDEFASTIARAQDRWKEQGFACAPKAR